MTRSLIMSDLMPLPLVARRQPLAAAADADATASGDSAGELLRRYGAGDDAAFAELVRQYQDAAHAAAWRVLGDAHQANDVVQEAFLRVIEHRDRYTPERPFRPWLLAIVRNLSIDHLRRRRWHGEVEQLAGATAPPVVNDDADLRYRVALVLDDLPEKYRTLLSLRELDGVPAEELATRFNLDYNTTRWRLHQARKLFRSAWCERFGEDAHV